MHIQFVAKQKPLACYKTLIENVDLLWEEIRHDYSAESLSWIHSDEIDLISDIYIEVITAQKIKVGFLKSTADLIAQNEMPQQQFDNLHWITIDDDESNQQNLLTKFLLFFIGMVFIPSEMGYFMADLADVKRALQLGVEAKYMSLDQFKTLEEANTDFKASIMLLNEDLQAMQKLKKTASLVMEKSLNQDSLTIVNLTNSSYLSPGNTILLVYKNLL